MMEERFGTCLKQEEEERKWERSSASVTTNRWLSRSRSRSRSFSDGVPRPADEVLVRQIDMRDRYWAVFFLT